MTTNAAGVANTTFKNFIDGVLASVVYQGSGTALATDAGNGAAFKDSRGKTITSKTGEFNIVLHTNPGGTTMSVEVTPIGDAPGARAVVGVIDPVQFKTSMDAV